ARGGACGPAAPVESILVAGSPRGARRLLGARGLLRASLRRTSIARGRLPRGSNARLVCVCCGAVYVSCGASRAQLERDLTSAFAVACVCGALGAARDIRREGVARFEPPGHRAPFE